MKRNTFTGFFLQISEPFTGSEAQAVSESIWRINSGSHDSAPSAPTSLSL